MSTGAQLISHLKSVVCPLRMRQGAGMLPEFEGKVAFGQHLICAESPSCCLPKTGESEKLLSRV